MADKVQKLRKSGTLDQQLVGYAEMAASQRRGKHGAKNWITFGAASAALAVGSAAEATVIYSAPGTNIAIAGIVGGTIGVDFDGDGTDEFAITLNGTDGGTFGYGLAVINNDGLSNNMIGGFYSSSTPIASIAGTTARNIAKGAFTSGGTSNSTGLTGSVNGILGVSFDLGAGALFGWIKVHVTRTGPGAGGAPLSLTLVEHAYEDVLGVAIGAGHDTSLTTTPVPEPASAGLAGLGLLALGAAGLRRMRKQRAEG